MGFNAFNPLTGPITNNFTVSGPKNRFMQIAELRILQAARPKVMPFASTLLNTSKSSCFRFGYYDILVRLKLSL